MSTAGASVTIISLHSYPVKSARALDHATSALTERGLPHDREWMVVDARGRFQTQRELPALARLEAAVRDDVLRLTMDGESIEVPLAPGGQPREVQIWQSTCLGDDGGDAAASWLSQRLGREFRLAHFNPLRPRFSDAAWTGTVTATTAFSDGYPLLVANTASLAELNARLQQPLPMNRFRPNVVIDGLEPWAEDQLDELVADGVRLRLVKPCARCVIPTTDQQTGVRGSDEVIRVLRELRYDPALSGVTFAQNAIIVSGIGQQLRVGQRCEVTWKRTAEQR
jgi:uncharacterized protein